MISVSAYTPRVMEWIAHTESARILHLFDQACNLIDQDGRILSIVTPNIGKGPFALVLDMPICFSDILSIDDSVSCDGRLQVGKLAIDVESGRLCNPRLEQGRLPYTYIPFLKTLITMSAVSDSLVGLITGNTKEVWKKKASEGAELLCQGIVGDDSAQVIGGVKMLAGLGLGLTPSGDDFLLGAMLALQGSSAMRYRQLIADHAIPQTNTLSGAWLEAAAVGEASEHWHQLFDALQSSDKHQIQRSSSQILRQGHTSGADALTGFVMIAESLEKESSTCR